ncbi:hypothetical protein CEXT_488531 [Caerostris extrusa]|uniref:Uncharacterized protein n=1 Tax=Caerostris extrusa TaxID=172846 RepID=A0AAV4QNN0_CAEEX|nr:hypothetical protein CEXT_488531 [Caerostris extrusa]
MLRLLPPFLSPIALNMDWSTESTRMKQDWLGGSISRRGKRTPFLKASSGFRQTNSQHKAVLPDPGPPVTKVPQVLEEDRFSRQCPILAKAHSLQKNLLPCRRLWVMMTSKIFTLQSDRGKSQRFLPFNSTFRRHDILKNK